MRKCISSILFCAILSGCASTNMSALSVENQDKFFTTSNISDDFDEFLLAVRKDEIVASSNANTFKFSDSALRLATLSAGLFAGYTSTFTKSVDLPEAGFAAASILGLGNYINAGGNRDASRQAARRLDCLIREAQPFKGDFYESVPLISQSLQEVTINRSGRSVRMKTLSNDWTRSQNLVPRYASDEAKVAPFRSQIGSSVSVEQVTYNNRFDIVINTYRQIIRNWESAAETEYQSYEQLLTQFQEAVKQDEEQTDEQEETAEMAKELRSLFGNPREIDTLAKVGTKYSSAKEAVIKCGGID